MRILKTNVAALTVVVLAGCSDGGNSKPVAEVDAADPLYRYQWYLQNRGQDVIADVAPTAGVDLNIGSLHKDGIRGAGVEVAVIDSGLEIGHEDLAANVVPGGSMNFVDNSTDPTNPDFRGDHGTSVAGIIAAVGWNGKGGRGVAPEAKLRGFNFLADQSYIARLSSLGLGPSANVAVFNNSWGTNSRQLPVSSIEEIESWENLMRSTRGGKGGIYIKSAGNSFSGLSPNESATGACADAVEFRLSCLPAHNDPVNYYEPLIMVGAVNASGKHSSYSSAGSNLWVSGFGGEYGFQKQYVAASMLASLPANGFEPAMLTTDQSGCDQGYNRDRLTNIGNALNTAASPIEGSCNYTAQFNGTSSAAPTIAGVAALMLQVNPNLSARDVKYILATTAKKIDPAQAPVRFRGLTLDPGWVTNAAGHPFSNWYGYGLVDAAGAVELAKKFTSLAPLRNSDWLMSDDLEVAIPYLNETQGAASIVVPQSMKVETVQLNLFGSHTKPANLRITLTSPSGTKSYMLTPFSALQEQQELSAQIASNAFLDENSAGTWTLQVVDVKNPNDAQGTRLEGWGLRVFGR